MEKKTLSTALGFERRSLYILYPAHYCQKLYWFLGYMNLLHYVKMVFLYRLLFNTRLNHTFLSTSTFVIAFTQYCVKTYLVLFCGLIWSCHMSILLHFMTLPLYLHLPHSIRPFTMLSSDHNSTRSEQIFYQKKEAVKVCSISSSNVKRV